MDAVARNDNAKKIKNGGQIKINSMKLIRLVRNHEVLYNNYAVGYNDKCNKDRIWEEIYRGLFPLYDTYKPSFKDLIALNVRRRWKTLRDSLSREAKKTVTMKNYTRRKESAIMAELEFLLPHIRSTHCAKLADELGLRENYSITRDQNSDLQEEDSLNNLVDLTEEDCDIKPCIKQDGFQYDDAEACDDCSQFSPQANIETDGDNNEVEVPTPKIEESINSTWNREFCTVAQFKGGEFINPVELCVDVEDDLDHEAIEVEKETGGGGNSSMPDAKPQRSMVEESSQELQAKILQFLSSIESRERTEHETKNNDDEDRMFLLSLVSDLKRVPAAKKMRTKMEIVTAIARANQCR